MAKVEGKNRSQTEIAVEQGIRITVGLSDELFDRARQAAREEQTSLDHLTATALTDYLDQRNETASHTGSVQTEPGLMDLPTRNYKPKVRIIAEIDASLGQRFKSLCRKHGWPQKDILERFIKSLVEHHAS
jgi:hypothetical protein